MARVLPASPRLAGLLLAAGAARRFGAPKLLASYRGETLLRRAVGRLLGCCDSGTTVVLGAQADALAASLAPIPPGLVVIRNPHWEQGLGRSLAAGVATLPAAADACLVLLADQAAVDDADLGALASAWRAAPARPVAATYAGIRGAPAILPRPLWPQLAALSGDRGAGALLAALPDCITVPLPHAALDVDTPDDLARLP